MPRFRTRGHARALALVERAVQSEQPPHALLLVGPQGIGKTTLGLDLARGLLCLAADPFARPCGECAACRKVDHANHPDLHIVAPQGAGQQIRVGQAQALSGELALLPLEGRFRIAIVQQAQRLNVDAQNALLKTLEEPPPEVVIVLAADDVAGLLPTVVSRCARLRLGPVAPGVIADVLDEAGLADRAQAEALARLAGGRPGAAAAAAAQPEAVLARSRMGRTLLSLLDADRRRRLAVQRELLDDGALLAAAVSSSADAASGAESDADDVSAGRATPAQRRAAAAQVISVWRDVARDLALAARDGGRELQLRELVDEVSAAGRRVDVRAMSRFLRRLDGLGRAVDAYANPDLVIDSLLLEWPAARTAA